jgi:hypothetical protein
MLKGLIAVENPQRSEDLQRTAQPEGLRPNKTTSTREAVNENL